MPGEIEHVLRNNQDSKKKLFDDKLIQEKLTNLIDPYGRKDIFLRKVDIDETYPEYIFKNMDKLSDYIA